MYDNILARIRRGLLLSQKTTSYYEEEVVEKENCERTTDHLDEQQDRLSSWGTVRRHIA